MKKSIALFAVIILGFQFSHAQRFLTKNGHIKFYSETPIETIEAHNYQVNSALDIGAGDFVFKVLMKSFEFEKALMQEHFNENYIESHKYPNATFVGKVTNHEDIDFTQEGSYEAVVEGKLTIHGVTNDIKETGTFKVKDGVIHGTSVFNVKLKDYDIKIPKAVTENIAETIEVTVDVKLEKME